MKNDDTDETGTIADKARRLEKARETRPQSALFSVGMFGMVGWAVAVPLLAGIAMGLWLDAKLEGERSWTLICLLGGAALGCINAWYWIQREGRPDD